MIFVSSDPEAKSIYVDANTRIQILDTILHLPQADREQSAAFIVRPISLFSTLIPLNYIIINHI